MSKSILTSILNKNNCLVDFSIKVLRRFFLSTLIITSLSLNAQITEIIDATGDGSGNTLDNSQSIAVDGSGNIYVAGGSSDNAFKITSGGTITEIIDALGDGSGNTLNQATDIAVDGSGNVYVAGTITDNVFKITSGGTITEIIDATGDGTNALDAPRKVTVDGSGNVYVAGSSSDNAFKITSGGTITEIIDATGDGIGNALDNPRGIAADGSGNVYVSGAGSDNAFKITSGGTITEIIDATGDGGGNILDFAQELGVDNSNNVYIIGSTSDNAFKITSGGTITEILDSDGDGAGNVLDNPRGIAVDGSGNVFVVGAGTPSDNAFRITPSGTISEIIDATGDGTNVLDAPRGVATSSGNVYVAGATSDNAFKILNVFLPVELVSFDGRSLEDHVILNWETSTELNNDYFTIERSSDGETFFEIGRQNGKGTTTQIQYYDFIDRSPEEGINYYRLKQIDFDGKFELSKVISVNFKTIQSDLSKLYPNPNTSGIIDLVYTSTSEQNLNISVFDLKGKILLSEVRPILKGENILRSNFSFLKKGVYIIKLKGDRGESSFLKLILN